MAAQLQPQTLDIKITKVTPKRVYYELYANGIETFWAIPTGSTFDTSNLVVGVRYIVDSDVVVVRTWEYTKRKYVGKQRFDWRTAMPVVQTVKLQARTKKQRQAAEATLSMPLVDNGELISWQ